MEKHRLPLHIFMTKETRNEILIKALTDTLTQLGFKVIDEQEWERLMKIHHERMFKLVAEDRAKGVESDPAKLNRRLPLSHQMISFQFSSMVTSPSWTITNFKVWAHPFPITSKVFQYEFPPEEMTDQTLQQVVAKIVAVCRPNLK